MLNSIEFFIGEAWTGFRRSGIMSFVAVGTIIVSLTIFGIFLMGVVNLGSIVGSISSNVQVTAYSDENLSHDDAEKVMRQISGLRGVAGVKFISKNEAWKNFKSEYGKQLNFDAIIDDNPLPDTFIISVTVPELVAGVARVVSGISAIGEVRYSGKLLEQVESLASAIRLGGFALVCMLSVATLLIVINTIRLTVIAREKDIAIMKLVGATNSFIKWPFIIEGIMIGIIGSAVSFGILKVLYDIVVLEISVALPFLPLVMDQTNLIMIYMIVGCVGVLLGMLGGYISVSKSLKGSH
jgi:cell division transport system permease protein